MLFNTTIPRLPKLVVACALLSMLAAGVGADSASTIDADVDATLAELMDRAPNVAALVDKASGVLVFPDMVVMGFGEGGQYGEGALRVRGETVAYFAVAGPLAEPGNGRRVKREMLLFMTPESLLKLRETRSYRVGVDAEVLALEPGGAEVDQLAPEGVLGLSVDDAGAIALSTMQGNVIARIAR